MCPIIDLSVDWFNGIPCRQYTARTRPCQVFRVIPKQTLRGKTMDKNNCQYYTYAEHRFRFAAWAAARAVKKLSAKKSTKNLTTILLDILRDKKIGFREISGKDNWLLEVDAFDIQHACWRNRICKLANKKQITHTDLNGKGMSHGQAAKLINVFIKTLMPSDMYNIPPELRECWSKVHPPVDRDMLKEMDNCGFGNGNVHWVEEYEPWTQLTSCEYEKLINDIRLYEPCLWKTERFWKL